MSRYLYRGLVSALMLSGAAIAVPAHAQNGTPGGFPAVSGEIAIELQNDWAYRADERDGLNNTLAPKIEPSVTVAFSPAWSVFAHAVIEPQGSAGKFENRVFEDLGLVMENLYLEYADYGFNAKAGKLNPGFGIAWDMTPGIYGDEFPKDYEISERIGFVGGYGFSAGSAGEMTLSAATFFQDTTILSESAFRGRGDTRRADGGPSNTEDFGSFLAALNGGAIPGLGDLGELGYHLSFMHQAKGEGDERDENSFAIGLFSSFDLGSDVTFAPLAEYVRRSNFDGVAGQDREYLTLAGEFGWRQWSLAVAWTDRDTERQDADDDRDHQFQVSGGYTFDMGLTLEVGWKIQNEARAETRTLGAKASYVIPF